MRDREVTSQLTRAKIRYCGINFVCSVSVSTQKWSRPSLCAMNPRDVCWVVATDIKSEANDVVFGHAFMINPEQDNAKGSAAVDVL